MTDLSPHEVANVLSTPRRCRVLEILDEAGGQEHYQDIAREIAAEENDKPEELVSSNEYKTVYVGLYQTHLPELKRVRAIDETDFGDVVKGPRFDVFLASLRALQGKAAADEPEDDNRWRARAAVDRVIDRVTP